MPSFKDLVAKQKQTQPVEAETRPESMTATGQKSVVSPAVAPAIKLPIRVGVSPLSALKSSLNDTKSKQVSAAQAVSVGSAKSAETVAGKLDGGTVTPPPGAIVAGSPSSLLAEAKAEHKVQEELDQYTFPDQEDVERVNAATELSACIRTLRASIDDKGIVGDCIKFCILHLKRHPFLAGIMKPEHIQLMVRGLRVSYGTVIVKKGTAAQKKTNKAADVAEAEQVLASLGAFKAHDLDM